MWRRGEDFLSVSLETAKGRFVHSIGFDVLLNRSYGIQSCIALEHVPMTYVQSG